MSAIDLDAITREVDRVRHVHAEIQNHTRPGLVTGYLICVEQSADDVPWLCGRLTELVAENRKLREQLGSPARHVADDILANARADADRAHRMHDEASDEVDRLKAERRQLKRELYRLALDVRRDAAQHTDNVALSAVADRLQALIGQADAVASAEPLTDRQLLAAVHRWARTHGWRWHRTNGWINHQYLSHATVAVYWSDDPTTEMHVRRRAFGAFAWTGVWLPVASVREAVGVLAALGVLPVELSSAWRTRHEPVAWPSGEALYVHTCNNVEWWDEASQGPINDQGCDGCESGPFLGGWQPVYRAGVAAR